MGCVAPCPQHPASRHQVMSVTRSGQRTARCHTLGSQRAQPSMRVPPHANIHMGCRQPRSPPRRGPRAYRNLQQVSAWRHLRMAPLPREPHLQLPMKSEPRWDRARQSSSVLDSTMISVTSHMSWRSPNEAMYNTPSQARMSECADFGTSMSLFHTIFPAVKSRPTPKLMGH